jgi:DNA-binding response OmpR family regulator
MARVLIVDDESNIRMMLRLALEHVGHTVGQAADGFEGLEKFGSGEDWDLVLLDHRMPGMEGLEVLKKLREVRSNIHVIMITAFGTIDLATEALQAGATDFLRKPFTIEVLRESVVAALSGKPHLPHVANAVPQSVLSFDRVGINGFRLASLPGLEHASDGTLSKIFSVQKTEGAGRACTVILPAAVIEQVKAHLTGQTLLGGDLFWEALCGEALANYLWQNANLPTGGKLVVEELTRGLERWVEALSQQAQAA